MKKFISIFLCVILFSCSLSFSSSATSNPYPQYNYYNGASDYQIACTWYAWKQANERLGISLPNWGNAGSWYSAAGSSYKTDGTPEVNSIACWSYANSPSYGHVAYVTGVNSDGSINIVEGGSGWSGNDHGVCSRKVNRGTYWPDLGFIHLYSSEPSVTFSPWDNPSYTYIGETDASIGQDIYYSGGTCTDVGMILFDALGNRLASASNGSYYYRVYFKINEELNYILQPGTQYIYQFFAVVNGKTYYSNKQSFTTEGVFVDIEEDGTLTVAMRESYSLHITVRPSNVNVVWESSNPSVATVKDGIVTGLAQGKTVITATAGASHDSCTVSVYDPCELQGHNWGQWYTLTDATCTAYGQERRVCTRCGKEQTRAIDMIPHNYVGGVCTRCGADDPNYNPPAPNDPCNGYTDINRSGWYHSAADFVIERGLMGSTKTDRLTFEPNTKVSRAMVASILYTMAGKPDVIFKGTFTDVKYGMWFTNAIEWCAQNGLASGKGNGKFDPNGNVTRQELAVFMMQMAQYLGKDTSGRADLGGFADASKVPSWAKTYVSWAVDAGLISGKASGGKTYLAPADNASRAELAAIIRSFVQNIAETE